MKTEEMTLNKINARAIRILTREIGLANTLKFINQYSSGYGDYTEERKEYFKSFSVEEIAEKIRKGE